MNEVEILHEGEGLNWKTAFPPGGKSWLKPFVARILDRIPVGYEDETGFHHGVPPAAVGSGPLHDYESLAD